MRVGTLRETLGVSRKGQIREDAGMGGSCLWVSSTPSLFLLSGNTCWKVAPEKDGADLWEPTGIWEENSWNSYNSINFIKNKDKYLNSSIPNSFTVFYYYLCPWGYVFPLSLYGWHAIPWWALLSYPNSAFSGIVLVAWNWPWWAYLPHRNQRCCKPALNLLFCCLSRLKKMMGKMLIMQIKLKSVMSIAATLWPAETFEEIFFQYSRTIIWFSKEVTHVTDERM